MIEIPVVPEKPVEPKLGKKPRVVARADREAKKKGYGTESDSYRWERCHGCNSIIGKDYSSFSHECEGLRAYRAWIQPQRVYEGDLRHYERMVYLRSLYDRILALGFTSDAALSLLELGSKYTSVERMREAFAPLEQLLEKVENAEATLYKMA